MNGWQDLGLSCVASLYWSQRQGSEKLRVPQLEWQCSAESEANLSAWGDSQTKDCSYPRPSCSRGLLALVLSPWEPLAPVHASPDSPAPWCFSFPDGCSRRGQNAVPRGLARSVEAQLPGWLGCVALCKNFFPLSPHLGMQWAGLGCHSCSPSLSFFFFSLSVGENLVGEMGTCICWRDYTLQ